MISPPQALTWGWTGRIIETGEGMPSGRTGSESGFTLLELAIILAIVGILVTMALPSYRQNLLKAREAVLMRDLYMMRDLLDQYRADKGKYPASLRDLVTAGYLRAVPVDPISKSATTWQEIVEATEGGVYDLHSGSNLVGTNGVPYNQW